MKAIYYHTFAEIRLENVPVPLYAADKLPIQGCDLDEADIFRIVHPVRPGREPVGAIVACSD